MKAIRFLPLVFVVGIDGFVMFAPYALLVLSLAHVVGKVRPQPAAIPVNA